MHRFSYVKINSMCGANEMIRCAKVLASKPAHLSWSPRTYMMERESTSASFPLISTCVYPKHSDITRGQTHIQKHKC